jgi:alkanesulfonate monooxygenase SsuD/methylene tetrahydromethanopterin reductase-like flavin-dependent oxidoreductase (luciferase family)
VAPTAVLSGVSAPRIGIQLPEVERQVAWPEYLAMARAAEAAGFDSIWIGDHLLYRGDGEAERAPWEAWTLLAALAAATERVDLGPLVACAAFHPPGLIAKMAATVTEISGGRFVLALGAGWNEPEFRAFGLPFDHRVSRFEESFAIIRRLLAGERVTTRGRYWEANDAVLLPRPTKRPRLMIGSNGPRMPGTRGTRNTATRQRASRSSTSASAPPHATRDVSPARSTAARACSWPSKARAANARPHRMRRR